jgi:hypothetical protein
LVLDRTFPVSETTLLQLARKSRSKKMLNLMNRL